MSAFKGCTNYATTNIKRRKGRKIQIICIIVAHFLFLTLNIYHRDQIHIFVL